LLIEKLITHGEASTAKTWMRRLEKTSPDSAITLALQAKLAIAENNREQAIDYAKRLMPGGSVPVDKPAQLAAVARLMEDLGFPKAADRVLEQYAGMDIAGIRARVEFLGRQGRAAEALDLLEANWDALSLERALSLGIQVLRCQVDDAAATAVASRLGPWIEKGKRLDPGSIVVRLIDAELQTLQGRTSEAEAIYRKLLAEPTLAPSAAAIVSNNLAFHLAKPATADEAGTLIDKAIAELGPLPDLLDTRGLVRLAKGEPEAAVTDLREAILVPSAAKYLHLAAAELAAGDETAARKSLEAARREKLATQRLTPEDVERLKVLEEKFGSQAVSTAAAGD
jgi:Tfp pilus assembly protein PilF